MKVNYLGTQYVHKFSNGEEVKYITCSNEDFKKIESKPTLEGYTYQYTVGGFIKVDTESGLLEEGQYTEDTEGQITKCYEDNGNLIIER